jgi:hypothetical protein
VFAKDEVIYLPQLARNVETVEIQIVFWNFLELVGNLNWFEHLKIKTNKHTYFEKIVNISC